MSEINIEAIEALRKLQEKNVPSEQETYLLFPNEEPLHRVAFPTYKQAMQADKCRFKRPRQDAQIIEQIATDYNWKEDDFGTFDSQLDYYKAILPIVCLESVKIEDDFSPMEADRMIRDFFICTFY